MVAGTSLAAATITFTGQLANMPVSAFTVFNSTLAGGTPTVATTSAGAYSTTFNGPGVLNVGTVSAVGNGTLALTAGTFGDSVGGLFTLANAITLNNNAVVTLGTTVNLTLAGSVTLNGADQVATSATANILTYIGGPIGGSGSLNLIGTGTALALEGANTYTGGTNLGFGAAAAALVVTNNSALGTGAVNLTSGTLETALALAVATVQSPGAAAITLANNITLTNAGNAPVNPFAVTIGGVFGATLTFTGNVAVTGATNTLTVTHPGQAFVSGGQASALIVPGVIFQTGVISGTGALTIAGTGLVQLAGTNTYTGGTTLTGGGGAVGTSPGTVVIANSSALGTGLVTFNASGVAGAVLQDNGSGITLSNPIFLASAAANLDYINAVSGNFTLSGNIGGSTGTLNKGIAFPAATDALPIPSNSAGTLVLTNAETYGGATVVNQGVLALAQSGTILLSASYLVNPGALVAAGQHQRHDRHGDQ